MNEEIENEINLFLSSFVYKSSFLTYHEPIKSLKTTTHPAISCSCNLRSYTQVTKFPLS